MALASHTGVDLLLLTIKTSNALLLCLPRVDVGVVTPLCLSSELTAASVSSTLFIVPSE